MKKPSALNQPHMLSEEAARKHLEAMRWPNGPVCPRCGPGFKTYRLKTQAGKREVLKCAKCRKQYSVTVGTIFEDSHVPLTAWFQVIHLLCSSKKGISAHQIHRTLGVMYTTAWFMAHRIRHAMAQGHGFEKLSGIVEADETYIGGKATGWDNRNVNKASVLSLIQRGGPIRSFHVQHVTGQNLRAIIREHVQEGTRMMTDASSLYRKLPKDYPQHETVNHRRKEYARGEAHVNTCESYFGILKRGIIGTYHTVSKQHLSRYLAEFDFRDNNRKESDVVRAMLAVKQVEGKRLQYH